MIGDIFEPGDKVIVVDPRGESRSQKGDILTIKSQGSKGDCPDFCRFEEVNYGLFVKRLSLANPDGSRQASMPTTAVDPATQAPTSSVFTPAIDPNDEMLTEDENEEKAKEFDAIMRQHSYKKAVKELREVQQAADEFWDGEHLSNAIEKTTSTARHPQAMWSV